MPGLIEAIKRINPELMRQAKAAAALEGIALYLWIEAAIKDKLERGKR